MKLFSQIDSLNNQNKRSDNNNELFSFHQNYQSNQSFPNFQNQKSKSKYSFKLQPQLYFQKRNQQKQKLYQLNSHITLLNESEEDSIKNSPKNQYQRKKIFNNDPRVSPQEKVEEKNIIPVISLPNQNEILKIEQQLPKETKLQAKTIPQQTTNQNNMSPIYANKTLNSSYSQRNNGRKINKISFDHEESNRFLMRPILEEPRKMPQSSPQIYPHIQNIARSYPKLIEKVEQNEKQLMDISKRLDNKIIEDNNKQQYFLKLLAEKDRQSRQKDKQIQYLRTKKVQNQKISFQVQQATRLQLLILQNKHLTLKVQKEQQRLSQQKEKEDLQKINQRIEELKKMRQIQLQTTTNFSNNSFNLDASLVPHHYIGNEVPQKLLVNILRTQNQDNSSHNIKKVTFKYPTISQTQLIPQRDIPHNASAPKVKQIYVPLTRID